MTSPLATLHRALRIAESNLRTYKPRTDPESVRLTQIFTAEAAAHRQAIQILKSHTAPLDQVKTENVPAHAQGRSEAEDL